MRNTLKALKILMQCGKVTQDWSQGRRRGRGSGEGYWRRRGGGRVGGYGRRREA